MIATKGSDVEWQWLRLCWLGRVSGDPVSRCAVVGGVDGNFGWNSQHGPEVVVASGMLLNAVECCCILRAFSLQSESGGELAGAKAQCSVVRLSRAGQTREVTLVAIAPSRSTSFLPCTDDMGRNEKPT
jgi:hypothetical protein